MKAIIKWREKKNAIHGSFFSLRPPLKYAETDFIPTMSWNSCESYGGKVASV